MLIFGYKTNASIEKTIIKGKQKRVNGLFRGNFQLKIRLNLFFTFLFLI